MGRVSRYRKISKDDPFAPKRPEKVDTTINFEPGKKDLKESGGGMTRSVARMIKAQERMKRNAQMEQYNAMSEKSKAKASNKPKFQYVSDAQKSAALEFKEGTAKPTMNQEMEGIKDDETYHEFTARMRETTRERTKGKVVAGTHRQEKTKEYYQKQREKKLKKRFGDNSDDDEDNNDGKISDFTQLSSSAPKFGEQAQRPPTFKKLPKNSQKVDMAIAKRVSEEGYSEPLMAFKEKKKAAQVARLTGMPLPSETTSLQKPTPKQKMPIARLSDFDKSYLTNADGSAPSVASSSASKSAPKTEEQKAAMAELRERVQAQYRALKEQRISQARSSALPREDRSSRKKKKANPFVFSKDDLERFQEMRPESKRGMKKAKRRDEWLRR